MNTAGQRIQYNAVACEKHILNAVCIKLRPKSLNSRAFEHSFFLFRSFFFCFFFIFHVFIDQSCKKARKRIFHRTSICVAYRFCIWFIRFPLSLSLSLSIFHYLFCSLLIFFHFDLSTLDSCKMLTSFFLCAYHLSSRYTIFCW